MPALTSCSAPTLPAGLGDARELKQAPALVAGQIGSNSDSIAALIASNSDFSTLDVAVSILGLADALGPSFTGTVFAPTNEALASLGKALGVTTPGQILTSNPDLATLVGGGCVGHRDGVSAHATPSALRHDLSHV